jgi:hypothetical membrane protein
MALRHEPHPVSRPPMKQGATSEGLRRPLSRRLQARFMSVINVPMRALLGLPFATPLGGRLMLVSLTGRKTGKHYRQPLSYVQQGNVLLTPGGGKWKLNLREVEVVRIRVRGRDVFARPELVSDINEIEQLLAVMTAANPSVRSFVGIPKGTDGRLDSTRLEAAIQYGFRIVRWHLAETDLHAVGGTVRAFPTDKDSSSSYSRKDRMRPDRITRWLAWCGVVGPVVYVLMFTLAGLLRPGYSPVYQTISDLGVGSNSWLVDGSSVLNGLLAIALVAAFFRTMRTVLTEQRRWFLSGLITLPPIGFAVAGIFTEAPSTLNVHWLVGADLAFVGPVIAFAVVGLLLRRKGGWRDWGTYSLVASAVTLVLVGLMFWVFTPGTPLAAAHLGGLMERIVVFEVLAWYVATGLRIVRGGSGAEVAESTASRGLPYQGTRDKT